MVSAEGGSLSILLEAVGRLRDLLLSSPMQLAITLDWPFQIRPRTWGVRRPPDLRGLTEIAATVRNAAEHARWFVVTAWQGGGSVVAKLNPIGPGLYRETKPIPVYGNWKATIRLQRDNHVLGSALFFPADPAIPAPAIPAKAQFTRPFVQDKKLLQREQKPGTSGVLTTAAYTVVLAIGLAMFALLAWGLVRLSKTLREGRPQPPAERPPSQRPREPATASA